MFIHLSASTDVRLSISDPLTNFNSNCLKTLEYLKYASLHNFKKFVFASSIGVSDPRSPYLASKVAGESYCKAFKESYNLNTQIIRFSNVYGPCSEFKNSVIPKFIKAAINDDTFCIYGNGRQTRDFVYVGDVVKAILNSDDELNVAAVASGNSISINILVDMLSNISLDLIGSAPNISHKDSVPGEINHIDVVPTISPTVSLENGLRRTFKWFIDEY